MTAPEASHIEDIAEENSKHRSQESSFENSGGRVSGEIDIGHVRLGPEAIERADIHWAMG